MGKLKYLIYKLISFLSTNNNSSIKLNFLVDQLEDTITNINKLEKEYNFLAKSSCEKCPYSLSDAEKNSNKINITH